MTAPPLHRPRAGLRLPPQPAGGTAALAAGARAARLLPLPAHAEDAAAYPARRCDLLVGYSAVVR